MILNDKQLKAYGCKIIDPFYYKKMSENDKGERILSYGLGSFGYDLRVSDEWKVFKQTNELIIDPKNFTEECYDNIKADSIVLPANGFALGISVETVKVPKDCTVVCLGKSTYARCGVIVNVTPIEAGWEGRLVIEFSNTAPCPVKLYANEGCIQLLFFKGEPAEKDYVALGGKYMNQTEIEVKV